MTTTTAGSTRRSRALPTTLLAAVLSFGCQRADSTAEGAAGPPPPVVETALVSLEDVNDSVALVGQLDSAYSVTLKPEISGVVASIAFEEGAPVKKGAPLIYLRDREQRARLREAEANVALASTRFERARSLAAQNAQSAAALDSAEAEHEIAKARLDLARLQLDRTVIRAPYDGVIGARLVSPGERVSPGGEGGPDGAKEASGLARIDSLDEMELVFTIPETVIAVVGKGSSVELRVAPFPGETFPGQIYFIDPRVNTVSRRVLVKARVPNSEHKLRPGLFAHLDMEVAQRAGALMVPEDAVVYGRDGTFVWRVVDGVATSVPVELGIRQPGRVELLSGVREGDRIVSAGTHKVRPGMALRDLAVQAARSEAGGT